MKENPNMDEKYCLAVARELVEDLRECDEGEIVSTAMLLERIELRIREESSLLMINQFMLKMAEDNKIELVEQRSDKDKPYQTKYCVHNRKAQIKCPYCGSTNTARYMYGLHSGEYYLEKIHYGKLKPGGCDIYENMPARVCNDCKKDFGFPNNK